MNMSRRRFEQIEIAKLVANISEHSTDGQDFVDIAPLPMSSKPEGISFPHYRPPSAYKLSEADCAPQSTAEELQTGRCSNFDPRRMAAMEKLKQSQDVCLDSGFSDSLLMSSDSMSVCSDTPVVPEAQLSKSFGKLHLSNENDKVDSGFDSGFTQSLPSSENVKPSELNTAESDAFSVENDSEKIQEDPVEKGLRNSSYLRQDAEGETLLNNLILLGREDLALKIVEDLNGPTLLDIPNSYNQTCVHLAVLQNMPRLVRRMLAHGATVDKRDMNGNTPLHIACLRGYFQCVEVLTRHLDYNEVKDIPYQVPFKVIPQPMHLQNYEGRMCIHMAAAANHFDIVFYLVRDMHTDVDAQEGKRGLTALHEAAESNRASMVMYLIQQCGANVHARSYDRRTALELANYRGLRNIVNLLKSAGAQLPDLSDSEEEEEMDSDLDDFMVAGQPVILPE